MDHTGKSYTEVTNCTLQDIDTLAANVKKLCEIQSFKLKHPISVHKDTSKTSKTDKPTTSQTSKSTTKSQPISIAQKLTTVIQKDTGTSGSPPPSPLTPHQTNTQNISPNSSPNTMPSLRDRAMFFPQVTFDHKDKTKTRTHLQSFEDFVDRQKLDPEKDFKEIQEYF